MSARVDLLRPLPPSHETAYSCQERVRAVFECIIDCLVLIGYLFQHLYYRLTCQTESRSAVFGHQIVCKTHNFAKLSDLWDYVKLRRNPVEIGERVNRLVSAHGFTNSQTSLWATPHNGGVCMGGVMIFAKKWLETKSINEVASTLEGGATLKAALYQKGYEALFDEKFYHYLEKKLREAYDAYPRPVTVDHSFGAALPLFEGLHAYRKAGFNPHEVEIAPWVRTWALEKTGKRIGGKFYASLRGATQAYQVNQESVELDRALATLKLGGLKAEVLHTNSAPQNILETVENLKSGTYQITFPTYSSLGKRKGYHTIALIIQEQWHSYFYDPNSCIAFTKRAQVGPTLQKVFKWYTGFDFSENQAGKIPSLSRRVYNFFAEKANPPSNPLNSGFDLFKITEVSHSPRPSTTA